MADALALLAWLGSIFSFCHFLLIALTLPPLMLQRKEPQATIAWFFAIVTIPILGALAYWAFGNDRMARRAARIRERSQKARSLLPDIVRNLSSPTDVVGQVQLVKLLGTINPYPPVKGNRVTVLTDMDLNFREQLEAIDSARDHVHLEYYIFRPDAIGERFSKAMLDAAARGVQVRFLFDAVGGMGITSAFLDRLRAGGVQVARHIPMNLLTRRWIFNFRNHRKILVVDGKQAFMGGANIGEEYLGRSKIGNWFDMHLSIQGPAVQHLQRVFADDWAFAVSEPIQADRFDQTPPAEGDIVTQVIPSGPDVEPPLFHELFFTLISGATERVRLLTPYFVPTEPLRIALETASRRGVDVGIIVPGTSTKPFVKLASHSYYDELLRAGVKIYEYTPGFLHAKMITVDGRFGMVGTPNFDSRSLRLNFEVGLALYDAELTQQLDEIFDTTAGVSSLVNAHEWRRRPVAIRVMENFARLFSPVL